MKTTALDSDRPQSGENLLPDSEVGMIHVFSLFGFRHGKGDLASGIF